MDLAANDGARALVLESTFTSLPDAAHKHFPWLPTGLLMVNRMQVDDHPGPDMIAAYGHPYR